MPEAERIRESRESELNRRRRERSRAERSGHWFQRAAVIMPDRADVSSRTMPAVVATESPIRTVDRRRNILVDEVLVAGGGRLPPWAPMLRSHETYDLVHSTLGSVLDAHRRGTQIEANLRFANPVGDADDIEKIWTRVRDGHLRAVSVGGRRLAFTEIEPGQTATVAGRRWIAGRTRPLRVVTRWVMREASVVIFGADADALTA